MNKKLRNTVKLFKKIFGVLFCILFIFLMSITVWNKILCIKEDKILNNVGIVVNVNNKNIRVSVSGNGEKTIVLLSGMGTPSPIIDFKPLAYKLSENYKVVTIEYAGYGLSEDSNIERNNKVIVEEIRETLNKLDIEPPYILMPHSISGVYAMQYMNMYPNEVEAMIGIDSSVPNQGKYENGDTQISNGLYYLARFMDVTGLTRLSYISGAPLLQDMQASGNYSEEDMKIVKSLFSRKSISKAQLSENKLLMNNLSSLYDTKYPNNIPILLILSDDSCRLYNKEMKEKGFNSTWENLHEEVISNTNIQNIIYLKGKHYLHWTQSQAIADSTEEFIEKYIN